MKTEKPNLPDHLLELDNHASRQATLLAGGRILRRRRARHAAMRILTILAILGVAAFSLQKILTPVAPHRVLLTAQATPAPLRSLTDDELLALFPDTPVALATLPDGKKRLLFPRPGDEARFITKL
jgi:hypothetical protein